MVSKELAAALYPEDNIEVLDEIRPVNIERREIDSNQLGLLLRLPESDRVKSNVRRITIERDFGGPTPGFLDIQVFVKYFKVNI